MLDQAFIDKTERRVETIKKRMAALDTVIHAEGLPGTFVTGGSGVSASYSRKLDRQLDRTVRSAGEWTTLRDELAAKESRLEAYKAGRVHKSGQPVKVAALKSSAARMTAEEVAAKFPDAPVVTRAQWNAKDRECKKWVAGVPMAYYLQGGQSEFGPVRIV